MEQAFYNEIVEVAREDAKETFLEEPLAYWYSGPPCDGEEFPPKAQRVWCDAIFKPERRCTDEEWEVFKAEYSAALGRAIRYVDKHWDPESEDEDHYEDTFDEALGALAGKS